MNELDLSADYPGFSLRARVLWDAQVLVLFGASGSGKTTILESIAGGRREATGRIEIGSTCYLDSARSVRLEPNQRKVGWAPQDSALFPHLSVRQNVEFGASRAADRALLDEAIEILEVGPLMGRRIDALSGGERQRVALARALGSGARVLLLDEPLASLDTALRTRILGWLVGLRDRLGVPIVYVSHDPREVTALAGHVAIIADGRVVADGPPAEVLRLAPVLSVLEAMGMENVFTITLFGPQGGLVRGRTPAGTELLVPPSAPGETKGTVQLAVRAEDLVVSLGRLEGVSARNQLQGEVSDIEPLGHWNYLFVAVAGEQWVVRVTADAVRDLELAVGKPVWILLKTSSMHIIER